MDIGLAFSYITKDREWVKKVLIGGLLSLIPIVGSLIVNGFMMRIMRNVVHNDPDPLPEWDNIGGDLTNGFLGAVGVIIWMLPIIIILICVQLFGAVGNDATNIFASFLACLVTIALYVGLVVIVPIIYGRLIMTGQFGSMFQFDEIFRQIQTVGAGPFALLFVVGVIGAFISMLGLIACLIGVIFTSVFANYAIGHAAGQVYRISQGGPRQSQQPMF